MDLEKINKLLYEVKNYTEYNQKYTNVWIKKLFIPFFENFIDLFSSLYDEIQTLLNSSFSEFNKTSLLLTQKFNDLSNTNEEIISSFNETIKKNQSNLQQQIENLQQQITDLSKKIN